MWHPLDILVAVPPQLLWNDRHGMPYRDIWPDKCPFRGPPKNLAVYMYVEEDLPTRQENQSSHHSFGYCKLHHAESVCLHRRNSAAFIQSPLKTTSRQK